MDELIIRVLDRQATPEEAERVAHWRDESPENRARFDAVRKVWAATPPSPLKGDVDLSVVPEIVNAARKREEEARRIPIRRPSTRTMALRWALPLAAGLAAVTFGVLRWAGNSAPGEVLVAAGEGSKVFVLEDGSYVRLAQGSRLRQDHGEVERRVELEGKALFAVAHDPTRPFVVIAEDAEVRVLGTRFEVWALADGGQRIAVLEGRVEVSNAQGRAELRRGEIAVAVPGAPPSRTRPDDLLGLLDWAEGTLLFRDTPLAQVAVEVARRYGAQVVVEGEALGATRISAWFGAEPFTDVIESLCGATNASCTISDTLAVLR